jgi:uncharacterized protein YecT (DUF1311 family)
MDATARIVSLWTTARRRAILTFVLAALAVVTRASARADTLVPYVYLACDQRARVAMIASDDFAKSDHLPAGYRSLAELPHYMEPTPPLRFCNLGLRRDIAVKVGESDVHPANDNMTIYAGGRPIPDRIWFKDIASYRIRIRPLPQNYFVEISICRDRQCDTTRITSPAFDCGKAVRPIEKTICNNDLLSEDDALLEEAYRISTRRSSNHGQIAAEQVAWLRQREIRCHVAADGSGVGEDPHLVQDGLDCLDQIYKARIAALSSDGPKR